MTSNLVKEGKQYIARFAEASVSTALKSFMVVCITGPRQCGKTTMVNQFASKERRYFDLDNRNTYNAIKDDITGFLHREPKAIIDEVHRIPELMYSIKSEVDSSDEVGRYIVTTSISFETLARQSDSLVGRLCNVNMLPLSQAEIKGVEPDFLECVSSGRLPARTPMSESEFFAMALLGGYPRAVTSGSPQECREWFKQHLKQGVVPDCKDDGSLRVRADVISTALKTIASTSGSNQSISRLVKDWGVAKDTGKKIIATLERLRLISRLRVHSHTRRQKRLVIA